MIFVAGGILALDKQQASQAGSGGDDGDVDNLDSTRAGDYFFLGVVPVCMAALLSGFGAAVCQRATMLLPQQSTSSKDNSIYRGNPDLFSFELSTYSVVLLLVSILVRVYLSNSGPGGEGAADGDVDSLSLQSFFKFRPSAMVPVLTNAFGGLLVVSIVLTSVSLKCLKVVVVIVVVVRAISKLVSELMRDSSIHTTTSTNSLLNVLLPALYW